METKELKESLDNQKKNLTMLLSAALQKQQALVNLDYPGLEEAILKEEKALSSVNEAEKGRLKILGDFYTKHSISNETFRLAEFIEKTKGMLDKESSGRISASEKELKELITRISTINQQNKFLVENSKVFIKETVSAILNARRSLLDKKI